MVDAWVEAANVEIPMVIRKDQHIGLDKIALTLMKASYQSFIGRNTIAIKDEVALYLFIQAHDRVGIYSFMRRMHPFEFGMLLAEPRSGIRWGKSKILVLKKLEREAIGPMSRLKGDFSGYVLTQTGDGQIAKTLTSVAFKTRENKCLLVLSAKQPDWILI